MHTGDCLKTSFENMDYNLLHHPKFELNCIQRKKERKKKNMQGQSFVIVKIMFQHLKHASIGESRVSCNWGKL